MSQFNYDSYDQTSCRVAFEALRNSERRAFWIGLLVGCPLGYLITTNQTLNKKIKFGYGSKIGFPIIVGSLIYGMWVYNAKAHYREIAAKVNRKYSLLLNKAMDY